MLCVFLIWMLYDVPDPEQSIAAYTRPPIVTVLDAAGTVIARTGGQRGEAVHVEDLPPYLPRAFLAAEDRRFYEHAGLDPVGLLRALWVNLRAGSIRQGGSTITQQLAKTLFLTPERTLRRKLQEAWLAFWLERHLSKNEILSIYLNRIYLGRGTYGVDAAARFYFGRPAHKLTVFEAAVLAGLPKAPSRDNPHVAPDRAERRARFILQDMAELGWLSESEQAQAEQAVLRTAPQKALHISRYFSEWATARAEALAGPFQRDVVIRTTLNLQHQRAAQKALDLRMEQMDQRRAEQLAFVSLARNGAVTAMIGGRNWGQSPFNRAVHALRQPGSAFKLMVWLAGLENGLSPDSVIDDRKITVAGWTPRNADNKRHGPVTLREAAARSLNSVAVMISEQVGRDTVVRTARRLGLSTPLLTDPALALGVHEVSLLELTAAYAVVASGGLSATPWAVQTVTTEDGEMLYHRTAQTPARLVTADVAVDMDNLLRAVTSWGTGRAAMPPGGGAAGKTGTTQNYRDAWFVGYDNGLTAGVWMGNDDNSPMRGVTGGDLPALFWRDFMVRAKTE